MDAGAAAGCCQLCMAVCALESGCLCRGRAVLPVALVDDDGYGVYVEDMRRAAAGQRARCMARTTAPCKPHRQLKTRKKKVTSPATKRALFSKVRWTFRLPLQHFGCLAFTYNRKLRFCPDMKMGSHCKKKPGNLSTQGASRQASSFKCSPVFVPKQRSTNTP